MFNRTSQFADLVVPDELAGGFNPLVRLASRTVVLQPGRRRIVSRLRWFPQGTKVAIQWHARRFRPTTFPMQTITINKPDDWHVHVRDGELLQRVMPDTARRFSRAIIMPNLNPPVPHQ